MKGVVVIKRRWLAWLLILTLVMGSLICMPTTASAASTAKLSSTAKMIENGKSFILKVTGTKLTPKYSTADKTIATVTSRGVVSAKKVGITTIYAKVGKQTLKCAVCVTYKRTKFKLYGQIFSLAIPPTWTYKYSTYNSVPNIEFYDKYVYQHYGNQGILFAIMPYTDAQLIKAKTKGSCIAYGKLGQYNFGAYFPTDPELFYDKTATNRYLKAARQSYSIAKTFLPAAKTTKQKAYNAYFQFLTKYRCAGCPFALAYITNDSIPELIVDLSFSKDITFDSTRGAFAIYTYKGGFVEELCVVGRYTQSAGYYYKKNIVFGNEGINSVFGIPYYNVSQKKVLLYHFSILNSGRRVNTYYKGDILNNKKISKTTFDYALKKITGGQKYLMYTFRSNTLANRKKYLNN